MMMGGPLNVSVPVLSKSGQYFRQDIFIVICLLTFKLRQKYNHFSKSLQ